MAEAQIETLAIRVLIAEDERLLRQAYEKVLALAEGLRVVGTAADGEEAVMLACQEKPDVVLMDMAMRRLDGLGATALIHERVPGAKVLILSNHDTAVHITKAVKVGVTGYVVKNVDLGELIRIIKAVHRGEKVKSLFLADQRLQETKDLETYGLNFREIQILKLLVQGENNSDMAEKLCVSEQTVKKDLVKIFEKLQVQNRTQAAVKAVQIGLVSPETAS